MVVTACITIMHGLFNRICQLVPISTPVEYKVPFAHTSLPLKQHLQQFSLGF